MEKLPEEGFIKVSRGLGINRSYVQSVYGNKLIMMDEEVFQIPATGCVSVKKAISKSKTK